MDFFLEDTNKLLNKSFRNVFHRVYSAAMQDR